MPMIVTDFDTPSNSKSLDILIKIGVVRELHKQELLSEQEMRDVIEFLKQKERKKR